MIQDHSITFSSIIWLRLKVVFLSYFIKIIVLITQFTLDI